MDVPLDRFAAYPLPAPLYDRVQRDLIATLRLLERAESEPDLVDSAVHAAADFVADMATLAWELSEPDISYRSSLRNRTRLARAAEAWMRAHLAEPVQVTDVCLALRVSRREIEYAFRSVFDQSPRDFLQTLRLNAIRRSLLRGEGGRAAVTRAALDHGITHLSRFSAQYRALFGESPSVTRRSRVGSSGG
jgi:transcriptional regulator GlxA family with amidase domain